MQTLIAPRLLLFSICLSTLSLHARTQAHAGTTAKPVLLVANQTDHDVSIIDPAAARQIAVVPEDGITGHEVAVTPDSHTAFVPIYGDSGVGRPGTNGSFMDVIDIASHRVTGKVDFGHGVRPHYSLYDPISRLLYVTTELDKTVTIVNPRTLKIVGTIPTAQEESHMLAISHDGRRGYTANVGPGTVSVLDLTARKTIAVIPVSNKIQRISISNDDRMVFTSDQTKPRLALIDTSTDKITAWVPLPALGYGTASTKDGRWLLVALPSIDKVAVLDLKERKVARTIDVPKSPTEILASPDGTAAYVSCGHSHQVAVIDVSQWKVRALIDAGQGADGMAWSR